VFPRDIICLRNISINTLHKGDDDDDDDDDNVVVLMVLFNICCCISFPVLGHQKSKPNADNQSSRASLLCRCCKYWMLKSDSELRTSDPTCWTWHARG